MEPQHRRVRRSAKTTCAIKLKAAAPPQENRKPTRSEGPVQDDIAEEKDATEAEVCQQLRRPQKDPVQPSHSLLEEVDGNQQLKSELKAEYDIDEMAESLDWGSRADVMELNTTTDPPAQRGGNANRDSGSTMKKTSRCPRQVDDSHPPGTQPLSPQRSGRQTKNLRRSGTIVLDLTGEEEMQGDDVGGGRGVPARLERGSRAPQEDVGPTPPQDAPILETSGGGPRRVCSPAVGYKTHHH